MFGALFALMVSTGLRSGEARAIRLQQIDRVRGGLVIDQSIDARHRIISHLKKGNDDDPRLRVVLVPSRAMMYLDWWMDAAPRTEEGMDLVFSYRGRLVRKDHLVDRFALGIVAAGIDTTGRKLTPHALRYTYNTRCADSSWRRLCG